jgi:hypothetical protein
MSKRFPPVEHQFKPGGVGNPRGVNGARNRLTTDLLQALAEDFAIGGAAAIKIMRIEEPAAYVKVLCSILPKELFVEQGVFSDMSDEDIVAVLDAIRQMKARTITQAPATDKTTMN